MSPCFANPACNRSSVREDGSKILLNCLLSVKRLVGSDFTETRARDESRGANRCVNFLFYDLFVLSSRPPGYQFVRTLFRIRKLRMFLEILIFTKVMKGEELT